jgi:hypothetical protein
MSTTVTIDSGSVVVEDPTITVQSVSPAAIGSPASITRDGQLTVVLFDSRTSSADDYAQLPSGCNVGDVFEMYTQGSDAIIIVPPSGEVFTYPNGSGNVPFSYATRMRKIASALWGALNGHV